MSTVASRDLGNHTAEVLRQVSGGTRVTVTVNGMPVAEISPVRSARKQFLTEADLVDVISRHQADAGLAGDLERVAGETTDDLGPLRPRDPVGWTPAS
ncbi:MAG: type II toxin-antitoxin system Phd/YefM family antitoxin [Jatrophihabitantaceae bacterium]